MADKEIVRGKISVVIRARNEEKTIGKTLSLVVSQTIKPDEIVLVDNSSRDRTIEIAKQFGCRIVNISDTAPYNHATACNLAMEKSKGEYVVFTNGHAFPATQQWLESGTRHFTDQKVAGCSGDVYQDERGTFWEIKRQQFLGTLQKPNLKVHDRISLSGSMNIFHTISGSARKEAWDQHPFDEQYSEKFHGGEDIDWAFYLVNKGYAFVSDPGFSVYHSHSENLKTMLQSQKKYMLMYLGAYFRYRPL